MHFSTTSPDVVKQAFTGIQAASPDSWTRDYRELDFPIDPQVKDPSFAQISKKNIKLNTYKVATQSTVAKGGEKLLGGFTKAPFASADGGWNISWETDSYQCGKKVSSSE